MVLFPFWIFIFTSKFSCSKCYLLSDKLARIHCSQYSSNFNLSYILRLGVTKAGKKKKRKKEKKWWWEWGRTSGIFSCLIPSSSSFMHFTQTPILYGFPSKSFTLYSLEVSFHFELTSLNPQNSCRMFLYIQQQRNHSFLGRALVLHTLACLYFHP